MSHTEPSLCICNSYLLPRGHLIAAAFNPLVTCNFNQPPEGFPTWAFPSVLLSPCKMSLGYLSCQMLKRLFRASHGATNSLIIDGLLYVRLGICSAVKLNGTMQGMNNSFQSRSGVAVILFIFLKLWLAMCFQLQANANQAAFQSLILLGNHAIFFNSYYISFHPQDNVCMRLGLRSKARGRGRQQLWVW